MGMSKKAFPYLFLALLVAILLFIVGVRYGQHVEKINKTISYFISIAPSPSLSPTNAPLAFVNYSHTGCGVSFLIPNELEKTNESSVSALFSTHTKQLAVALSCEKKLFTQEKQERAIIVNTFRTFETTTKDTMSYRIYNPKKNVVLIITAAKNYIPLIQKSFSLIN